MVSGCNHGVVGPIVCGNYTLTSLNHGKPAYRKESQPGKPDVMLYFWDERDGPGSSGWWLSPKIGSEVVWGFHPNRACQTPPTSGWKVPYDGGVDPHFLISTQRRTQQLSPMAQPVGAPMGPGSMGSVPVGAPSGGAIRLNGAAEARRRELQLEEARRQQDEANRRRMEEQRKRMEDVRKAQEEAARKQKEEQQRRVEAMRKQQEAVKEERRAVGAIRQVLQKIRVAKIDDFELIETELQMMLEKELANCGSQKTALKEESTKTVEQARQRIDLLRDQKRKMEEKRAEEERRRKEAQELAEKLLSQLADLVDAAEASAEELKRVATKFEENSKPTKLEDVGTAAKAVEEQEKAFKSKTEAANDFINANRTEMLASSKGSQVGVLAPKIGQTKEEASDDKPSLGRLQGRLQSCNVEAGKLMSGVLAEKDKKEKRISAKMLVDSGQASFRKYDKDKDGALNRQEVLQYAKGECGFTLPSESLDLIFEVMVKAPAKGVSLKDAQRLKVMVGIAREKERDSTRLEDRLAKEKELAETKAKLEESVKEIQGMIDECEAALKKVEELVKSAPALKPDSKAKDSLDYAGNVEEALKHAKEDVIASTKEKVEALNSVDSPDHKPFLRGEVRRLQRRMSGFEGRTTKVSAWLKKTRAEAERREGVEVGLIQAQALRAIRWHQKLKKLEADALFGEFDAEAKGSLEERAFLAFFSRCEEEQQEAKAKAAEGKKEDVEMGDAAAEGQEEKKEGEEDKKEEKKEDKMEVDEGDVEKQVQEAAVPPVPDLQRLFVHLRGDGQTSISKEAFTKLVGSK